MAGVIDEHGVQWERCNGCAEFVEIETMLYERKSEPFPYGRDLCPACAGQSSGEIVQQALTIVVLPPVVPDELVHHLDGDFDRW